jgi:hypothetical protein
MNVTRIKSNSAMTVLTTVVMALSLPVGLKADTSTAAPALEAPTGTATGQTSAATQDKSGPFDWTDSRLPIHFTLDFTTYYDDNIFISPVKTSDQVFHISPGVNYAYGQEGESDNYLSLKYVPTIIEYYTNSQQDAVDQYADMTYEHNFKKLKLTLDQNYIYSNQTSIQAGTIVVSSAYNTNLKADYNYSDKVSIEAYFNQNLSYYNNPGYNNIYEWSGGAYFLYQITPKFSMGVGPSVGTDQITNGVPSQTWEQGLVHLTYSATEKINLTASFGGEVRQFDATGVQDQVTGVFNLGAYWTPFEGTALTLNGYRHNNPSYAVTGTNYTATGVSAGIRQSFLTKFDLGLNGGYENDAYTAANTGITGARNDNYYFIHPYVEWHPKDWCSATLYYQYSANDSNLSFISFNDNQVGITLSLNY